VIPQTLNADYFSNPDDQQGIAWLVEIRISLAVNAYLSSKLWS
jgi:hypothetical protein